MFRVFVHLIKLPYLNKPQLYVAINRGFSVFRKNSLQRIILLFVSNTIHNFFSFSAYWPHFLMIPLTFLLFSPSLSLRSGLQHPGEHGATVLHGRWAAGASLHHWGPERPRAFLLGVVGLQQLTGGRGGPQCRACPGPRLCRPWGGWSHDYT